MVRVFLLALLFALAALGTAAYADCTSCFTSVFAQRTSTNIDLSFTAQADENVVLPGSVVAVVMQVDGNRTKCLSTTLSKTSQSQGVAVYRGSFGAYGRTRTTGGSSSRVRSTPSRSRSTEPPARSGSQPTSPPSTAAASACRS